MRVIIKPSQMLKLKPTRNISLTDLIADIDMPEGHRDEDMLLSPNDGPVFQLQSPSFDGSQSSASDPEEKHDMMGMDDQFSGSNQPHSEMTFRQLDYLWLFDPFLQFNKRSDFRHDDSFLSISDYEQMRSLNRTLLTLFLIELPEMSLQAAALGFSEISEVGEFQTEQKWADECIDEEIKGILLTKANGAHLTVDLTAHMDYFYNTLDCHV